jgi:hypothetical protein
LLSRTDRNKNKHKDTVVINSYVILATVTHILFLVPASFFKIKNLEYLTQHNTIFFLFLSFPPTFFFFQYLKKNPLSFHSNTTSLLTHCNMVSGWVVKSSKHHMSVRLIHCHLMFTHLLALLSFHSSFLQIFKIKL